MLIDKALSCDEHALNELSIANLIPFRSQVERDAEVGILSHGGGDIGFGQHADGLLAGSKEGAESRMLSLIGDFDLILDTVLLEKIIENVFGGGGFARCADAHACKIRDALYGIAVFEDVQYAEGSDTEHYDILVELAVKNRSQVDGYSRNINLVIDEFCSNVVGCAFDGNIVIRVVLTHELNDSHTGRTLEGSDTDGGVVLFHAANGHETDEHEEYEHK